MRKMGMVVLVVCLLGTVPVMAGEGQERGGWWDGVVEWVAAMVDSMTYGIDSSVGSDVSTVPETGPDMEPNGLVGDSTDTGPGLEPNG
jgi:hypothetical protein